jgi:hypothetical protein
LALTIPDPNENEYADEFEAAVYLYRHEEVSDVEGEDEGDYEGDYGNGTFGVEDIELLSEGFETSSS